MWKYYVLRLAFFLLGWLPLRALYGIARVVGDGAYVCRRSTRQAVASNMRQVMGPDASEADVQRATRDVFRNATRYYADLIHISRLDVERLYREYLDVDGEEYLREAQESGRGAVIASTHFGNPEMSVQGLAASGFSIMGLTERLHPKQLSDFTDRLRSRHGHVYRTVGYRGLKEAIERLKQGGLVAVLVDRDVLGTGEPMEFFGATARIPLGAADLALRTGADLLPAKSWRMPGYSFRIRIEPPLTLIRTGDDEADLLANMEPLLRTFEDQLRTDPGQWAVLEAIWRDRTPEVGEVQ